MHLGHVEDRHNVLRSFEDSEALLVPVVPSIVILISLFLFNNRTMSCVHKSDRVGSSDVRWHLRGGEKLCPNDSCLRICAQGYECLKRFGCSAEFNRYEYQSLRTKTNEGH
jgi:hypothetical protein